MFFTKISKIYSFFDIFCRFKIISMSNRTSLNVSLFLIINLQISFSITYLFLFIYILTYLKGVDCISVRSGRALSVVEGIIIYNQPCGLSNPLNCYTSVLVALRSSPHIQRSYLTSRSKHSCSAGYLLTHDPSVFVCNLSATNRTNPIFCNTHMFIFAF